MKYENGLIDYLFIHRRNFLVYHNIWTTKIEIGESGINVKHLVNNVIFVFRRRD